MSATDTNIQILKAQLDSSHKRELALAQTLEQVKPIIKALELAVNAAETATPKGKPPVKGSPQDQWRVALALARKLGFLDTE